ncbi:MAG: hypothetical protein PHO12_05785 [Bacteroidales bacterium]|nr:hypothetical protein [Bacteroidales bacterium]MDD4683608.1 hypothetical protein [Bacteroidales bacterium]
MQNINSAADLKKAIIQLELDRTVQWEFLQEQVCNTYESMKPVNLIKSSLIDLASSPYLKNKVFALVLGSLNKFISKHTSKEKSANPLKNFFNNLLQVGVTNFIVNPIAFNLVKGFLMQSLFKKTK